MHMQVSADPLSDRWRVPVAQRIELHCQIARLFFARIESAVKDAVIEASHNVDGHNAFRDLNPRCMRRREPRSLAGFSSVEPKPVPFERIEVVGFKAPLRSIES